MSRQGLGQLSLQHLPLRGQPALQAVTGVVRADHQIPYHNISIAPEARACRDTPSRPDDLLFVNRQLRVFAALVRAGAALIRTARGVSLIGLLIHFARLELRTPLAAFEDTD